jgi:hypothetical protein
LAPTSSELHYPSSLLNPNINILCMLQDKIGPLNWGHECNEGQRQSPLNIPRSGEANESEKVDCQFVLISVKSVYVLCTKLIFVRNGAKAYVKNPRVFLGE